MRLRKLCTKTSRADINDKWWKTSIFWHTCRPEASPVVCYSSPVHYPYITIRFPWSSFLALDHDPVIYNPVSYPRPVSMTMTQWYVVQCITPRPVSMTMTQWYVVHCLTPRPVSMSMTQWYVVQCLTPWSSHFQSSTLPLDNNAMIYGPVPYPSTTTQWSVDTSTTTHGSVVQCLTPQPWPSELWSCALH